MSGYAGSPSGYLNPVAVDKIQHPDYDAKAAENTTMRMVQYLYPVIKNSVEMLEALCKETDVQVPTDLHDNMEFLKTVYNTQIDWHPRTMYGDEAAEELYLRHLLPLTSCYLTNQLLLIQGLPVSHKLQPSIYVI